MKNINLELFDIYFDDDQINTWLPPENNIFIKKTTIDIGVKNEIGSNIFFCEVTSPEYLASSLPLSKKKIIILEAYSQDALSRKVKEIIKKCERGTFDESCLCLAKYFHWEYEDYKP